MIRSAVLAGGALAVLATCAWGKPPVGAAPAERGALDADVALTDGPGATTTFKLHGSALTKIAPRGEDGATVGVYRATVAASDSLRGDLAKVADAEAGPPPVADTPAVVFVVRRASGERRVVMRRPPADPTAARILTALERQRTEPLAALKLVVLPWWSAPADKESGARLVTVRLTAEGVRGADVRVRMADLALEMADVRPLPAPGVTALPAEWLPVSEPTTGPATRVLAPGVPVEVALRAPVPASGAFLVRATLNGPVTFHAPAATEVTVSVSSKPVAAPAR